ncbi:hypothetical protein A9G24_04760 [Gilliamella sp. App6-5]|nr:hypothetical protein A9G24_04760 [Gilliamella apicola]
MNKKTNKKFNKINIFLGHFLDVISLLFNTKTTHKKTPKAMLFVLFRRQNVPTTERVCAASDKFVWNKFEHQSIAKMTS